MIEARIIITDLDGTLLEPDGRARPEAVEAVAALVRQGVPICPLTSKTAAEIGPILRDLGLAAPAGVENGAAIRLPDGAVEVSARAVPVDALRAVLRGLRRETAAPVRSIEDVDDGELAALTGLAGEALAAARRRSATLPLLVAADWDVTLAAALPPGVRLLRGNRFLHLQGNHDKADLVDRLCELAGAAGAEVIGLGDAPNDEGLLARAARRVIVPSVHGPHPALVACFPDALVAPHPHGRGWAAVTLALVGATA